MIVQSFEKRYNDFFAKTGAMLMAFIYKRRAGVKLDETLPSDDIVRQALCYSELFSINKQKENTEHMFIPRRLRNTGYEMMAPVEYRNLGSGVEWSYQGCDCWKPADSVTPPDGSGTSSGGTTESIYYKETTGNRSVLYLSALKGRQILLLFTNAPRPLDPVSSAPKPGEYSYNYNTQEITFGVPLELNETVQILNKALV